MGAYANFVGLSNKLDLWRMHSWNRIHPYAGDLLYWVIKPWEVGIREMKQKARKRGKVNTLLSSSRLGNQCSDYSVFWKLYNPLHLTQTRLLEEREKNLHDIYHPSPISQHLSYKRPVLTTDLSRVTWSLQAVDGETVSPIVSFSWLVAPRCGAQTSVAVTARVTWLQHQGMDLLKATWAREQGEQSKPREERRTSGMTHKVSLASSARLLSISHVTCNLFNPLLLMWKV